MVFVRRLSYSIAVATLIFSVLLTLWSSQASAQQGVSCNPDTRSGNSSCASGELCRRLGGDCGSAAVNAICIDNSSGNRATAIGAPFCPSLCRGSRGLCESDAVYCNFDSDCVATLEKCTFGRCEYQPGSCRINADCGAGSTCDAGKCAKAPTPQPPPHGCTSTAQCPKDKQCVYGVCSPLRCPTGTSCGPGLTCTAGRCLANRTPQCTSSAQCRSDEVCSNHKCMAF